MTVGQRIKNLRTEKGLTQKDLADQLHVTFQTISKWEKDENQPDLAAVRELAKIFGCSLDYLLGEDEDTANKEAPKVVTKEVPVIKETVIIRQNEMHVCTRCGKDIPENELVSEDITKKERVGRTTRTVSVGQAYYHKSCLEEVKKERKEAAEKERKAKASRSKKLSFGWGIGGGVIALVVTLLVLLMTPACKDVIHPAIAVLLSIVAGYGIFSMLYCILSGSYIGSVFAWCAGISINFPKLIFSWDLDGFAWLIAMKILFAVLGFLIGLFALLFAIGLSSVLGMISFPFVLIHNVNTDYADAF